MNKINEVFLYSLENWKFCHLRRHQDSGTSEELSRTRSKYPKKSFTIDRKASYIYEVL